MRPVAATDAAFALMRDGSRALSRVEANGLRVDVGYLDRAIEATGSKIKQLERQIREDAVWGVWTKLYGKKADVNSPKQLARVIFGEMGVKPARLTKTGEPSTDEPSLEKVDYPFIKRLLNIRKLTKVRSTYLVGWRRQQVGGYLHATYNLHVVVTYRSSGSDPNVQNVPVRDPRQAKLIRPALIPRGEDRLIVEVDYSAAEVRVAACYHKDPTMVKYIEEGYDLHRDMAAECFMLDEVPKSARQEAKGKFVFAEFYGDWYKSVCKNLWAAAEGLTTADGTPMREHLAAKGIRGLGDCDPRNRRNPPPGTYERHIMEVENRFWGQRFPVYTKWKNKWWDAYLDQGWFQMLTGFVCKGLYKRNDVINYPVQGAAFHCLLWSLCRFQEWLEKYKMRTLIIGQVHDSMLLDVHKKELPDVLAQLKQIMTGDIQKAFPWMIVPMEIEAEGSDESWHKKAELTIPE